MNNNDKQVATVYTTNDYDKFSFLDANRVTDHVNALALSFKNRFVPNAIICNEKLQIIDGQNRFLASKKLGLPVYYYIINGLDIYDVAALNSYGKNWSNRNFAQMWASLGKDSYRVLLQFSEKYNELSFQTVMMLLSNSVAMQAAAVGTDSYVTKGGKTIGKNKFKAGEFTVKDLDFAYKVADAIMEYKEFVSPGQQIYKQFIFASAMMQIMRNNPFDNKEMVRRARMYPQLFKRCVDAKSYIFMLEDLWNHRRRHPIRFQF